MFFFTIFIEHTIFFSKIDVRRAIFRYNLVRFGSGTLRDVFTTFVLLWNHPAGAFFSGQKSPFSEILDMVIFQKMSFRQKLDFWVT